MPHIHTNPGEYDFCASAFIVRLDPDEPRLLLHRHKKLGTFIQFGGHVETKENPWQALDHELREESGYELAQLRLLQPPYTLRSLSGVVLHPTTVTAMSHDFDENHKHTDLEYAFTTTQRPRHSIAQGESQEIRGFTRSELDDPSFEIPDNVREIGVFILEVCLEKWDSVDPPV